MLNPSSEPPAPASGPEQGSEGRRRRSNASQKRAYVQKRTAFLPSAHCLFGRSQWTLRSRTARWGRSPTGGWREAIRSFIRVDYNACGWLACEPRDAIRVKSNVHTRQPTAVSRHMAFCTQEAQIKWCVTVTRPTAYRGSACFYTPHPPDSLAQKWVHVRPTYGPCLAVRCS